MPHVVDVLRFNCSRSLKLCGTDALPVMRYPWQLYPSKGQCVSSTFAWRSNSPCCIGNMPSPITLQHISVLFLIQVFIHYAVHVSATLLECLLSSGKHVLSLGPAVVSNVSLYFMCQVYHTFCAHARVHSLSQSLSRLLCIHSRL